MKHLLFRFQFIIGVFLLVSISAYASDDDLITKQITVKLDKAGTLPDRISSVKKYKITNLKIVGEINGTDVRFIREMAGCNYCLDSTDGKLAVLDLSDVKIVEGGDYYYYNGRLKTHSDIVGSCFFWGCSSLVSVNIPSGLTIIGDRAFSDCSSLANVNIPSSVTSIGERAFSGCSSLANVNIPSSVTSIGESAFNGCSRLTNVNIPSSVTSIENSVFCGCSSLASINIPPSVTSIGESAFSNCSSLTSVNIPSSVTSIGDSAFYSCFSLTSINIPPSVTSICSSTFSGCSSLTSVNIHLSVTSIESSAFRNCSSLTSVNIPLSVTSIEGRAFADCKGLKSVYVSWKSPISINVSTFENINKTACTLYVPQGTKDDYWLSNWGDSFDNIVEYDVTGIGQVTDGGDAKEVSRYAADGKRLDVPAKGLNIVRYSDGSVRKVAVQ